MPYSLEMRAAILERHAGEKQGARGSLQNISLGIVFNSVCFNQELLRSQAMIHEGI